MSQTLLIMIDDTDPGISYTGNWIADKGSKDNLGNYGAPYMSTNHHIEGTGSFTYTFSGTYVGVFGTTLDGNDPARECQVDGVTIPNNHINTAANWFMHCQVNGLADTRHTLVVTVPTPNPSGYWFDFLFYIPSAGVSRDNAALSIENSDPVFEYGSGWTTNGPGHITNTNGASMTMQFTGRSLTWLGYYFSQLPYAPTTATWSVDNGSPVTFNLNGIQSQNTGAEFNQRFFTTGLLPAGQHTLRVVYNGNSDTTPLSMYNVVVQNGASAGVSIGGITGGGSSSGGGGSTGSSGAGSGSSSVPPTISSAAGGNNPTTAVTGNPASTPVPQPSTVVVVGTGAGAVTVTVPANSTATNTAPGENGAVGPSGSGTAGSSPISSGSAGSNNSGGVANSDSSAAGANGSGNNSSTNNSAAGPTTGSKSKIGPIVGAVVGVLAILLLLFIVFFLRRRNRKRRAEQANGKSASKTAIVEPFISARSSTPPPMISEISSNDHSGSVTSESNHTPIAPGQFYSDVKHQPADVEPITSTSAPLDPTTVPNKPWRWQTEPLHTPSQTTTSAVSPSSSDGPESEIIMLHEDSGVRLPLAEASRPGVTIVEMPPTYSAT